MEIFMHEKKKKFKNNATISYQHFIFITSAQTDLPQLEITKKRKKETDVAFVTIFINKIILG
jgi:hypothetical protein